MVWAFYCAMSLRKLTCESDWSPIWSLKVVDMKVEAAANTASELQRRDGILKRFGGHTSTFDKSLLEVVGISMESFMRLVIVWWVFCTMNREKKKTLMRTRLNSFVAFINDCSENRMCLEILTASCPTCDVEETTDMAETFVVEAVSVRGWGPCYTLQRVMMQTTMKNLPINNNDVQWWYFQF